MDQRAGQVVHRVEQAENSDEVEAADGEGMLQVDRMLAYNIRFVKVPRIGQA